MWLLGLRLLLTQVDMFGPNVGFVKFKAVATVNGVEQPGIVFMRGDAIGVLVILECHGKEWTILTVQTRVPQGVRRRLALSFLRLPHHLGCWNPVSHFLRKAASA